MNYIYLAKLENKKYFIGTTMNIEQKIENIQEIDWTKKYKPIEYVLFIPNCNDIDKYVIFYMQKYGINNVRGGTFNDIILTPENINLLKQLEFPTNKCYICGDKDHTVKDCSKKNIICNCVLSYFVQHYITTCNMYKPLYDNEDDIIEQLKNTCEPIVEPIVESVVDTADEHIIEPIVEPIGESVVEPIVEPIVETSVESVVEPINVHVTKPIEESITEPKNDIIVEPIDDSINVSINDFIKTETSYDKYFNDLDNKFNYFLKNKENDKINDKLINDLTSLVKNNSLLSSKQLEIEKLPNLEHILYTPPSNIKKNNINNRMPIYTKLVNNVCSRCGRTNHKTLVCHAIKHIKGYYL
jgi:hypothetical protein